jgi:hypothetical protein
MQPEVKGIMTPEGFRRTTFVEPGPVFVTAVRLDLDDGRQVSVPFMPDPEPATQGMTRFMMSAPPGGGWMRGADLLAEDGCSIFRISADPALWLSDGSQVVIPLTVEVW